MTATAPAATGQARSGLAVAEMAATQIGGVLERLDVTDAGLTEACAAQRLVHVGPNAVASHRARFLPVLWHQLRSPLLGLLLAAALASYFVGERTDAVIIAIIVTLSVGLGCQSQRERARHRRGPRDDRCDWCVAALPRKQLCPGAAQFGTSRPRT